ncbi:hypothetical protein [Cytobacillus horneckiae]|uniref:Uncharacterized protein n=1 Tax=Cytobacillus horneckiae TaxID=549687 RepID=A0A2N0ZAZ6_9BACI|nr:hypothetical protein [Cytobacillus horneckiae]MEC1158725.1 hypothetical protein [Cytobacillus horneckiae]NRG47431.1 hypothetical protein [Bacillus sp. CRN 9]PKG26665.1 hypothetical protein CWS20_22725 [Cytobacillus horneckiae]
MLEIILINLGVSTGYIDYLKNEPLNRISEKLAKTYDYSSDINKMEYIPVNKIKGLCTLRGKPGVSLYENFNNYKCSQYNSKYNLEKTTVETFIDKMQSMSLKDIHDTFISGDYSGSLNFTYYKDVDEYYVGTGGSHRTLFAIITSAPLIYGKVHEIYELNTLKESNYIYSLSQKQELNKLVSSLGLELKQHDNQNSYDKEISYYYSFKETNLKSFDIPTIYNYGDDEQVIYSNKKIHKEIEYLQNLRNKNLAITPYPTFIRQSLFLLNGLFRKDPLISDLKKIHDL